MDKKDILIIVFVIIGFGLSIYRRMNMKKNQAGTKESGNVTKKRGLSSQPDDYEPYSGKKD